MKVLKTCFNKLKTLKIEVMPTRSVPAVENNGIHIETHRLYLNCLIRYLEYKGPTSSTGSVSYELKPSLGFSRSIDS